MLIRRDMMEVNNYVSFYFKYVWDKFRLYANCWIIIWEKVLSLFNWMLKNSYQKFSHELIELKFNLFLLLKNVCVIER